MQTTSPAPDIASLLAETRGALAHLRADELEDLAVRAEAMLADSPRLTAAAPAARREYKLLGDLLDATSENLRVLRRLRRLASVEGSTRWEL